MAANLEQVVLVSGLTYVYANATILSVCQTEPTTLAIASTAGTSASQGMLGTMSWGAGAVFSGGVVTSGTANGMKVTSANITAGTIVQTGTASWWAIYNASSLFAHGAISTPQVVTSGNTFTLTPFSITLPSQ